MSTPSDQQKKITFIQDDVPPLKAGLYALTATQTIPNQTPGMFQVQSNFIVQGERFAFSPDEMLSVFPPALANGEFDGDLPHVVFSRRTLPWERSLRNDDESYISYPWLAVLLFNDGQSPTPAQVTAKDLIPVGTPITVTESTVTGTGTLPATILSYGAATLNPMGYGETPDDPCTVIDIPVSLFNQIAPTKTDVGYLAHIREVDTSDGVDGAITIQQLAIVVGNRIPVINTPSHAFLVSLENLADYLPNDDGSGSSLIPAGTVSVRLITYRYWIFTANNLDERLEDLLANINTPQVGPIELTTLQLPITGSVPTSAAVSQALSDQAAGQLTEADATVLVQNALLQGYVPLNHHLRHGGQTVSWYRGPLAPFAVAPTMTVPISGPDAAIGYNPETGLFDISYGAAWQLGQLLALQNTSLANGLYQWKQTVRQQQAVATEQQLLQSLLQNQNLFESFLGPRAQTVSAKNDLVSGFPDDLADWFGKLATLQGVPFNYLVPDEGLLPQESLRFFYLDFNWIDALIDGAFSIGRNTTGEANADTTRMALVRKRTRDAMRRQRPNRTTAVFPEPPGVDPGGEVTGFLMRSQAISGWPNLRIKGYSDTTETNEIPKLRLVTLANDVMLGLFEGALQELVIEEPPEALHLGVEGSNGVYTTTLRQVSGPDPGQQYGTEPQDQGSVSMRSDGQTIQVTDTANSLFSVLSNPPFSQTFALGFTSAEFALEMDKGVVKVDYTYQPMQN